MNNGELYSEIKRDFDISLNHQHMKTYHGYANASGLEH